MQIQKTATNILLGMFCVTLACPVLAEEENLSPIEQVRRLAEEQDKADEAQARKEAKPAEEKKTASAVPDTSKPEVAKPAASAPAEQSAPAAGGAEQSGEGVVKPKSSVPADQRKGGDITQCLSTPETAAADKKNKEVAACAEPYSPRHQTEKPKAKRSK